MSTTPPLRSLLAEDIKLYLDFKRAIGRKFNTEESALRLLDRFLSDYPVFERANLTPPLVLVFVLTVRS